MATPKKPAAAAPAVKPAADKPVAVKKVTTPVKKAAAPKKSAPKTTSKIGPEERYRMTEVAAYYIAERDGFAGNPSDYWIKAEAQINLLLKK